MDPSPSDGPLQLVFRGECLDGFDPPDVRRALAGALGLDDKRADRLFSGKRTVVKRDLDVAKAQRYVQRFARLGAVLHAEPSRPPAPRAPTAAARTKPAEPRPAPLRAAVAVAGADAAAAIGRRLGRRLRGFATGVFGTAVLGLGLAVVTVFVLGRALNALWPEEPAPSAASAGGRVRMARAPRAEPMAPSDAPTGAPVGVPLDAPVDAPIQGQAPAQPQPQPQWQPRAGQDSTPALAPRPPAGAGRHGAAAAPGAVFVAGVPQDMSAQAVREYGSRYLSAPRHKAFAISSDGAHGWHAGAGSANEASERALEGCMAVRRPSGDAGCRVVDTDGRLIE